jgi:hypothetical protein
MKMGTMKRIIWLALVMALTVSVALADEQDLRQYAEDNLTEVYGYLEEEVRDFVFETRQDGSLAFWPKAHPGWIYTVFRGAYGQMDGTTPFHTGYTGYCGENAVRELLRTMEERTGFPNGAKKAKMRSWTPAWKTMCESARKCTSPNPRLRAYRASLKAATVPRLAGRTRFLNCGTVCSWNTA